MTGDRELMQMALKRLERTLAYSTKDMHELDDLKALLRDRLAQPEPDAVLAERDRCLKILLKLHRDCQHRHNYYLYAARQIDDEQVDFRGDLRGDFRGDFRGNEEVSCKTHPDAPHGFDRNASLSEDRYVCECESWEPPNPSNSTGLKLTA